MLGLCGKPRLKCCGMFLTGFGIARDSAATGCCVAVLLQCCCVPKAPLLTSWTPFSLSLFTPEQQHEQSFCQCGGGGVCRGVCRHLHVRKRERIVVWSDCHFMCVGSSTFVALYERY